MYNPFKFTKRNLMLENNAPFVFLSNGKIVSNNLVDAEQALKNSDVYAVVNRIASDVANCDIDAPKNFHAALYNPNKIMNKFSFFQSILASMLLNGNAFVAILHRNGNNIPDNMELVPSQNVQMELTNNQDILYTFSFDDGRPEKSLLSKDVLHFKLMATGYEQSMYTGRSPLESLQDELQIQTQSHKLTLTTLLNGINPTMALEVPEAQLNSKTKNMMRDEVQEHMTGDNVGKVIVLDQSAKLNTISINADVAKFLNNYKFEQTQIAKAFGIPDSYLNGQGDQQSSSDMLRSLYISSLSPYIAPIESELTKKLGVSVKLNILSSIDKDHQTLISNVSSLAQSGAITPEIAQKVLADYSIYGIQEPIPNQDTLNSKGGESVG